MYTTPSSWIGHVVLITLCAHSTVARATNLDQRDAASDLQAIFNSDSGGTSYTWTADSTEYNITLQYDPNCASTLNESTTVGPYTNARNEYKENATLGDIASDVVQYPGSLNRNTRRQISKANQAIHAYLQDQVLCDGYDVVAELNSHDELRRKLLDVNKLTWLAVSAASGWLLGSGASAIVQLAQNDYRHDSNQTLSVRNAEIIANGFVGMGAVLCAALYQDLITNPAQREKPALLYRSVGAFFMRLINFLRGRNAGGAGTVAGLGGGADIEMGVNGQALANQGVGLDNNGAGGKIKRDTKQCMKIDELKSAVKELAAFSDESLGLISEADYNKNAGSCPL